MSEATRRLSPDARRAQLVDAALDLLGDRSFDDVTHDVVAATVGVSKALVFHYFPTKRELHVAVVRAGAARLLRDLDTDPALAPDERLRLGVEAFIAEIERHPQAYRAMARSAGAHEQLLQVYEGTRSDIVAMILAGLGLDGPHPPLLETALRGWIAMVEEAALYWVDQRPASREELVAMLHAAAFALLAHAASPPQP